MYSTIVATRDLRSGRALTFMLLMALLLVAACRGTPSDTPAAASAVLGAEAATTACDDDGASTTTYTGWTAPDDGAEILPLIVSSQVSVGPSRLLYTVMDADYDVVAAADLPTRLRLYALDRDVGEPVVEVEGTFLDTGTGRGLYRAAVDFACAGTWGAELIVHADPAAPIEARTVFRVAGSDSTPAIGSAAPRSQNLTASTLSEVLRISTDPDPDPEAYRLTIAEAVTSGRPSVVFFATPAFCQSGVCGPTVEMVKNVLAAYRTNIEFVIVEPYQLRETANGLQPELDEQGRLQLVEAVMDYGIVVEPYLFVVDADGDVAAKFEVVVGEDELRGALEDVLLMTDAA